LAQISAKKLLKRIELGSRNWEVGSKVNQLGALRNTANSGFSLACLIRAGCTGHA
jgi:hypothetical protein